MITQIPSFIINLENKPKRYQSSLRALQKLGIYPERFEAVNASQLPNDYLDSITYPSVQYHLRTGRLLDNHFCSYGAVGCSLSHIQLWRKLLESEHEMFLIFEDDIEVHSSTTEINQYLETVQKVPWDVAYLGFIKPKFIHTTDIPLQSNLYRINDMTLTTHAYVIHRRGAEKLLTYALPIVDQLDSYMSFMMEKGVQLYRPHRSFVTQTVFQISELQTLSFRAFVNRFSNRTWFVAVLILIVGCIWIARKFKK